MLKNIARIAAGTLACAAALAAASPAAAYPAGEERVAMFRDTPHESWFITPIAFSDPQHPDFWLLEAAKRRGPAGDQPAGVWFHVIVDCRAKTVALREASEISAQLYVAVPAAAEDTSFAIVPNSPSDDFYQVACKRGSRALRTEYTVKEAITATGGPFAIDNPAR